MFAGADEGSRTPLRGKRLRTVDGSALGAHVMIRVVLLLLGVAGAVALPLKLAQAQSPGQCKQKTAGFYLQYSDVMRQLSTSTPGIAASLTGALGDPVRGRTVMIDRSKGDCLSCHKLATANEPDQGEVGPALDGVGGRFTEPQLRQMLIDPKVFFPDTIMPSYHAPGAPPQASLLSASEVEDLVAFMKSLK